MAVLAVLALGAAGGTAFAAPPAVPDPTTWVPNASVETIAFGPDGTVYVGGAFTYFGPSTGGGALLNSNGGLVPGHLPVTGTVSAVIPDGAGGYYIGGLFTRIGTVARRNLAHLLADGSLDPTWAPQTDNGVRALAVGGGRVYAAGSFEKAGGQPRQRLAAFDTADGSLDDSWNPGADGPVYALAVSEDAATVYVGGIFTTLGGEPRRRLAAVTADGHVDPAWNPGADDYVSALAVSGPTIYIGGRFTTIDNQPRVRLAALDAASGHVDPRWRPAADATVLALAVSGGTVYAGGYFTRIDNQPRASLAALDAVTGGVYPAWNPVADGSVSALTVRDGTVYVAGSFEAIGGTPRARLAALGAADGRVDPGWNPTADRPVTALAVSGGTVYAGGAFSSIGGLRRNRLAALDANGRPTDWAPSADGTVMSLTVAGDKVYAGGYFHNVNGEPRAHLAAIALTNGEVDPYWRPAADSAVSTLVVAGRTVYAGGSFRSIDGLPRASLAAMDARNGRVRPDWNPGTDGGVDSLVTAGDMLYAGGNFMQAGGEPRNRLAAFDVVSGRLSPDWKPAADGWVWALAVAGDTVYAGGYLTSVDGVPAPRIAALDARSGHPKPEWNPNTRDLFETVHGIAVAGDTVYAVGGFLDDSMPRPRLVALAAASGELDPHWNITSWDTDGSDGYATSVAERDGTLYAGGYFAVLANQPCRGFAAFRGFPSGTPSARLWAVTYEATSTVGRLDPPARAVDTVGAAGVQLTDVAFRGHTLFGVGFNDLYQVNTATGVAQRIGPLTVAYVNALAVEPESGVLYAANRAGQLVTVDPHSGRCTEIGSYGPGLGSDGDLAFLNGTLYATVQVFGGGNGLLARIDTQTGRATVLGDTGYVDVYGLIGERGFLYGLTWKGELLSISPLTGQAQFLWQVSSFPGGGLALAPPPKKPLVVLVSGIGARVASSRIDAGGGDWSLVKRRLERAGYSVFVAAASPGAKGAACPFALDSTSGDWTEQARRLDLQLAGAGYRDLPVVLIGHTTGGLIARAYAQDSARLTSVCEVRGIVQLGTPNDGSQLAELGGAYADSSAAHTLSDAVAMAAFNATFANAQALPFYRLAGSYFPKAAAAYLAAHPGQALTAIFARLSAVYAAAGNDGATAVSSVRGGPLAGDCGTATFRAVSQDDVRLGAFRHDAGWLLPQRTGSSAGAAEDARILRAIVRDVQAVAAAGKGAP
jgi:hypothetical protein